MHRSIINQTILRSNRTINSRVIAGFHCNPKLFMINKLIHSDTNNNANWKVSIKGGLKGVIQEQPKKGWYTIQLVDEKDQLLRETQKARISDFEIIETIIPMSSSDDSLTTIESSSKLKTERTTEVLMNDIKDIDRNNTAVIQENNKENISVIQESNQESTDKVVKIDAQQDIVHFSKDIDKEYSIPIIHPPLMHLNCKNWIIFSDLHVKGASIDICEEVLSEVHKAALSRNAGIIFLGDFWHVRGSLIVDLLNRILKELRKWTQPVIMIPGNHDQVTLGGTIHALEPLLYAFQHDQIVMINEPSICMGALWIPYRRDPQIMKKVLDQATSVITAKVTATTTTLATTMSPNSFSSSNGNSSSTLLGGQGLETISMIFCHADVKGAYMNDGMRSSEGLDINIFPPNMPIFSGHFHKPHTITKNKSTLRYVGSPYQTSLSEAGQEKYFYCVQYDVPNNNNNSNNNSKESNNIINNNSQSKYWREIERWPVSIGSKIIKASSLEDPLIKTANPGDRVVISVPMGQDYAAQKLVDELQLSGITNVELRPEQNPLSIRRLLSPTNETDSSSSIALDISSVGNNNTSEVISSSKIEDMHPVRIFKNYMDDMENITKNTENIANQVELQKKILTEGISLIEKLMSTTTTTSHTSHATMTDTAQFTSSSNNKVFNLNLNNVTLSNFGPYASTINYPLSKRGLVLLKGQSSDGTGADSNGSGKTTLAMSIMWALTGSLDARLVGDNRLTDVAFDASLINTNIKTKSKSTAEVSLFGMINDQSFELVRRRSSKKTELSFNLDNQDLTTQSVRDTQVIVDQVLGIGKGLIERCCFFGQHTHTLHSLLGLTDVKLKNELSNLVDTSIWINAVQELRSNEKLLKTNIMELNVESKLRNEESLKNKQLLNESISILNKFKHELIETETQLTAIDVMNSADNSLIISNGKDKELLLKNELETIENSIKVLKVTKLDPLRIELRKSQNNSLIEVDKTIEKYKLEMARLKSEQNTLIITVSTIQQKVQNLNLQSLNLSKVIEKLNHESFKLDLNYAITGFNSQDYYSKYETHLKNLTTVNLKISETNLSLSRLNELKSNNITSTTTATSNHSKHHHHKQVSDYECPTCGQEMPLQSRERRHLELTIELDFLRNKQVLITKDCQISKKIYDSSLVFKTSLDQNKTLMERLNELNIEEKSYNFSLRSCITNAKALEMQLNNEINNKLLIETELNQIQNQKINELEETEKNVYHLDLKKNDIIMKLDKLRQELDEKLSIRNSFHTKISLLKDRIANAEKIVKERQDSIDSCNKVMHQNELKIKELIDKINILDKLIFILGPKSIQNYVFQSVILQLESIANGYLMILADGGIQLSLQGDLEDADRIVKSVLIRSKSDSKYRERTLSQLSGGQWRRVSLALDLAFAELIRRRGILRCNLMVMDEVLTHLDASGREAVGTVLRYMVGNTVNETNNSIETKLIDYTVGQEIDDDSTLLTNSENTFDSNERNIKLKGWLLGGGNYETVIVILQDLAAAELEESFDHIDIVMKESDASTVIIDGKH